MIKCLCSTGRCESRTWYVKDGKLIKGVAKLIEAAKLIDLENYIKNLGDISKYIFTHRHFFFSTRAFKFESKCTSKVYIKMPLFLSFIFLSFFSLK